MTGETWIVVIVVVGLCLVALVAVLGVVIGRRLGTAPQGRLERGFERARRVEQRGSGEQGRPYTMYGKSAWCDNTRDRD